MLPHSGQHESLHCRHIIKNRNNHAIFQKIILLQPPSTQCLHRQYVLLSRLIIWRRLSYHFLPLYELEVEIKAILFYYYGECTLLNTFTLFEKRDATKQVATFYLFAIAEVEFGAKCGYNNCRYQIPPLDGAVYNTNRPVYNTTD